MNQGRRKDQERDAYTFCAMCFLAVVGLLFFGMVTHDGGMFPWMNIVGMIGLGMTIKTMGVLK